MKLKLALLSLAALFVALSGAAVTFTTAPSIAYVSASQKWQITFAVSEYTDVEVTIVKSADSSIVRRFAAGMLGSNPPPPFAASSLSQTLLWDGRDELGATVASSTGLTVRVRAGMSVALDKFVDQNPYYFNSINGIAKDDNGLVYVYGAYGSGAYNLTLRQYDANGNYVRTVIPFPAGLDTSSVFGWGFNLRSDNTYCVKYQEAYNAWLAALAFSPVAISTGGVSLKSFTISNQAFFTRGNNFFLVGATGTIGHTGELPLITSPTTAAGGGPQFYTKSLDGKSIFISGAYAWTGGYQLVNHLDFTGFWKDGVVYRMDMATGVVVPWHTFIQSDSIPDLSTAARQASAGPAYEGDWTYPMHWAAIHGIALDDSGHVLICDRIRKEVGIYDTATFAKVGSIPVESPHMVEVNKTTGEIYILTQRLLGYGTGNVSLYKYSGWRSPVLVASRVNFLTTLSNTAPLERFFVVQNGAKPVIWLSQSAVYLFQDDGNALTVIKNFDNLCADERAGRVPTLYERIAVDRKTETVYANNSWASLFKVSNWASPKVTACTTSTRQRIYAGEAAVSPDGFLYARTGNSFSGPLQKFTLDNYPAPATFKGSNQVHDDVYGKMGIAYGDLGLTVSRTGRALVMEMGQTGFRRGAVVHGTDPDSTFHDSLVLVLDVSGTTSNSNPGGLKVDYDGNIYIGYSVRPASHVIPSGFAGDRGYLAGVGCIYKLPPSGTQILGGNVTGLSVYPQGLGVFSPNGPCACRTPRFDLDPWGRLFIPNAITSDVVVADNKGNNIVKFGEYGNMDSKGLGSLVPGPSIPLAAPLDCATSDNYIYISDWTNARLVRVKMNFALENIHLPLAQVEEGGSVGAEPQLASSPNPFNPSSFINISLPGKSNVKLAVFSIDGRLVRTLAEGTLQSGAHRFSWDARDASGRTVSAGVYIYKLIAGNRVLLNRTILAK